MHVMIEWLVILLVWQTEFLLIWHLELIVLHSKSLLSIVVTKICHFISIIACIPIIMISVCSKCIHLFCEYYLAFILNMVVCCVVHTSKFVQVRSNAKFDAIISSFEKFGEEAIRSLKIYEEKLRDQEARREEQLLLSKAMGKPKKYEESSPRG